LETDLSKYNINWYAPGNRLMRFLWFVVSVVFIQNKINPFSSLKVMLLRIFGAKIGRGVVVKPGVNIKYPWKLEIGNYVWIGEDVWIDNLDNIVIGNNVCISQGVMLLCGNHNYKKSTFDLIIGKIKLKDGVWLGAKSIVTQNVVCENHSVLTVNSVASSNLDSYSVYSGNPAKKARNRI
jgi:putative colanic acid biosynthesis acetyltransferase WcaF